MNGAQANSVRNLQTLYTIIVGLALESAIVKLFDASLPGVPVRWSLLPILLAFLVTLIPFFHGAQRHLDATYVEEDGEGLRRGALLADFVMLFLESALLFGLAALVARPRAFAWTLIVLLSVDIVWGVMARFVFSRTRPTTAPFAWARLNLVTIALAIVGLLVADRFAPAARDQWLPYAILGMSFVRTAVDYRIAWGFYFPPRSVVAATVDDKPGVVAAPQLATVTAGQEQRTIANRRRKRRK